MKKINFETVKTTVSEMKESFKPVETIKSIKFAELKETPYNGMISSAFWMAGKIPVAGKIATKVLAESDLENKSKNFANMFFNPFAISNKLLASKN